MPRKTIQQTLTLKNLLDVIKTQDVAVEEQTQPTVTLGIEDSFDLQRANSIKTCQGLIEYAEEDEILAS